MECSSPSAPTRGVQVLLIIIYNAVIDVSLLAVEDELYMELRTRHIDYSLTNPLFCFSLFLFAFVHKFIIFLFFSSYVVSPSPSPVPLPLSHALSLYLCVV